ncbi:MAG: hypothetical protein C0394_03160 [Syntrophus sp. (in: bacteria)]|nr:hypothetical protein [Syntrophus sp. (in: bacteria)]
MDTNFFEFWGQSFLNIAKGQRQIDEFRQWLRQGLSGSDSLSVLFRQIYGLDSVEKGGEESLKLYEKAMQSFQQSFRDYLRLFDVAPREEFENLKQECEALKQKISEQEQTIGQLRKVLGDKGLESDETVRDLQILIKKQTDQFQEMMKATGQAFQKKLPSKSK